MTSSSGFHLHDVRSKGELIRGTNGLTSGIVPMLRVLNETARYINQAGKRPGAIAIYLEPHHPDIFDFLELRRSSGDESERCRDLFPALWLSDLFMRRVQAEETWSLFDPKACPGLSDVWGEEYDQLYHRYEAEGRYKKQVPAMDLWFAILTSIQETSLPYMLSKDACNRKSNQRALGVIKSSNLCTEIVEFTSPDEIAVCESSRPPFGAVRRTGTAFGANITCSTSPSAGNLASISLPAFLEADPGEPPQMNYQKLMQIAKVVTRNLNRVIDVTYYPLPQARTSNMRHRPIGIGVQGQLPNRCVVTCLEGF